MNTSYSQENQDIMIDHMVFKGHTDGFYVDIGAHDGITYNNTLYFNKNHNWRGINIEPNYEIYKRLKVNRPNDININCAIANYNGMGEFIKVGGESEMISGLTSTYDDRHYERMKRETDIYETIKVSIYRLQSILDMFDITHINYLSIDVEGGEFEVIKSIDFNKVMIDVIGFENNYFDKSIEIVEYLNNDFIIIHLGLDIIMLNKKSKFKH